VYDDYEHSTKKNKKVKDKQGFIQRLIAPDEISDVCSSYLNDANKSCQVNKIVICDFVSRNGNTFVKKVPCFETL